MNENKYQFSGEKDLFVGGWPAIIGTPNPGISKIKYLLINVLILFLIYELNEYHKYIFRECVEEGREE